MPWNGKIVQVASNGQASIGGGTEDAAKKKEGRAVSCFEMSVEDVGETPANDRARTWDRRDHRTRRRTQVAAVSGVMPPGSEREKIIGQRLFRARIRAGFATASEFARYIDVKISTYCGHENGARGITPELAIIYSKHLRLPLEALLYGDELSGSSPSRIIARHVGTINGGGMVTTLPKEDQRSLIFMPDTADLQAYEVLDDDSYPALRRGDFALHKPLDRATFTLSRVNGMECIVELEDGRRLLRQVVAQADGLATLIAYHAPPTANAHIVAASAVEMIYRGNGHRVPMPAY